MIYVCFWIYYSTQIFIIIAKHVHTVCRLSHDLVTLVVVGGSEALGQIV